MKKSSKKKIHLICQAKGGVGKSFLTYLIHEKIKNEGSGVGFLDLDNANRTTLNRLPKQSVEAIDVLTEQSKIDREAFVLMFEDLAGSPSKDTFWVDMGATESIEFLYMLRHNFPPQDLKIEFDTMGIELEFDVIVAGGDVFNACSKYLNDLIEVSKGLFKIQVRLNLGRFNLTKDASDLAQIQAMSSDAIQVTSFGSTSTDTSDKELLELIKTGVDIKPAELPLTTRIKYRKLLSEIEC